MSKEKADQGSDVKARYMLICEAHSEQGGKHTYYGVFDKITADKFPCVAGKIHIGVELEGPPDEERRITVEFVDSQGSTILPPIKSLRVRFSPCRTAVVQLEVGRIRFPHDGFYSVVVRHKKVIVGERTLYLEKALKEK